MKRVVVIALLLSAGLYASSGEEIYKAKCAVCHKMQGLMTPQEKQAMQAKMQNATKEERMAMREQMMLKMKKSGMRAPAMPMVSMRLKKMLGNDKKKFVAFVDDYIQNPSQEKGFCMPMAYKRFGTMPPIGKAMSKEERISVATWLYENFKGSWDKSADGKMCDMKNKAMKCGGGKCGKAEKKSMKCGAGKCGTVKIETH